MLRLRAVALRSSRTLVVRLLAAMALLPLATAHAQGAGYWHTSGSTILDANGQQVRIAGLNWYGFETKSAVLNGLELQDYKTILTTVKSQGYNALRVPLSSQMIETPSTDLAVSFGNASGPINADLRGLNSLQVLDKVVDYAGKLGLKVILDHHRSEAGSSAEGNGLWYTNEYPESAWIADWVALADRYAGNPTVIGFDLQNEPHVDNGTGACWDCGGPADWHLAAERAGNAVLKVNPNLLIFVEGVNQYGADWTWWGGNLEGVARSPVLLSESNRLVYSPHEYGPSEAPQKWFNYGTTYASLVSQWTKSWAYISQNRIAPVWVGEFGTTNNAADLENNVAGSQGQWFQSFVQFLSTNKTVGWTYWAVNGEDRYGLLGSGYNPSTASAAKQSMLARVEMPFAGASGTAARGSTAPASSQVSARTNRLPAPAAPAGLTAMAASTTLINLGWVASATVGVGLTVYRGTSSESEVEAIASSLEGTNLAISGWKPGKPSVPLAPSELTAKVISPNAIHLSWLPSASNGVTYNVYGSTTPGGTGSLLANGSGSTSFQATGLKASTTYYFTVRAVSSGLISSASNSFSGTTQAAKEVARDGDRNAACDRGDGLVAGVSIVNTGAPATTFWKLSGTYARTGHLLSVGNAGLSGTLAANTTNPGIELQTASTVNGATGFFLGHVACTSRLEARRSVGRSA